MIILIIFVRELLRLSLVLLCVYLQTRHHGARPSVAEATPDQGTSTMLSVLCIPGAEITQSRRLEILHRQWGVRDVVVLQLIRDVFVVRLAVQTDHMLNLVCFEEC